MYSEEWTLRDLGEIQGQYYLRLTTLDEPGVLGIVGKILGEHGVSVASCIQKDPHGENSVHMVMMTHESLESSLREAIVKVDALDVIAEPTRVIRVL